MKVTPGAISQWKTKLPKRARPVLEAYLKKRQAPEPQVPHFTVVASQKVADFLGDQTIRYRAIPLLHDRVAAGPLSEINPDDIEEYVVIYQRWAKRGSYCLRIKGQSMLPQFHEGDLVGVSQWKGSPRELANLFVAVWLPGEGVTIKRLRVSGDGRVFALEAMNPAQPGYPRILSPDEIDTGQWWRVDWWWGHQP